MESLELIDGRTVAHETEQEFNVGDQVTFNAYIDRVIAAKVLEVLPHFSPFNDDNRISYRLEGISAPLVSVCTGLSIRESKYFIEPVRR